MDLEMRIRKAFGDLHAPIDPDEACRIAVGEIKKYWASLRAKVWEVGGTWYYDPEAPLVEVTPGVFDHYRQWTTDDENAARLGRIRRPFILDRPLMEML